MLVKIKYRLYTLLTILFFVSGIISCKDLFKDPSKDKETGEKVTLLLLDRNFINTKINIRLVDINNQQLSTTEPIQVQFDGSDSSNLITFAGKKQTSFSTSTGYVEVGYDPNVAVTTQDPIELTVIAKNSSYISAPLLLSYTTEGTKDVTIKVYPVSSLKSAQVGGYNEPFDISFNNQLSSSNLLYLFDISASPTGSSYEYRNLYLALGSGSILCNNLKDNVKFSDYGIYYSSPTSYSMPPSNPIKTGNLSASSVVYSAVLPTGKSKCDKGLKIHVSSSDGSSGSGAFDYKITFSDNSTKTDRITCSFPSDTYIEQIYYPTANPAVKVELFGDAQYDVSSAVNLSSVCDGTASFTVTPKSGLKAYKLVTRYSCPDSNMGLGLSIPGEFRQNGSSGSWTTFKFEEGICTIQLVAGQEYEFRFNIDGKYYSYLLPTDPNGVKTFLQNTQSQDFSFRNLEVTNTATLVIISCDVQFSQMVCDEMDTGL